MTRTRTLAAGFLAAFLLLVPNVSSAATVSELQAQIQALLSQIAALQAQLDVQTTTSTSSSGTAPSITSFTVSPASIRSGDRATLSWTARNADGCQVRYDYRAGSYTGSGYLATVSSSGTYTVNPSSSTVYELYCSKSISGGVAFDSKKVTVSVGTTAPATTTAKAPTCELSVTTPYQTRSGLTGTGYTDGSGSGSVEIKPGDSVKIRYQSTNALYATGPYGDKDVTSGFATYTPTTSTSYVWTFAGNGGTTKCGVLVSVKGSNTSTPSSTSSYANYRGYLNGSLFVATNSIRRDEALSNCKLNAANNPWGATRCTWGNEEIYSSSAITPGNTTANTSVNLSDSVLRVVAVYESEGRKGSVSVNVPSGSRPVVLALLAYEPVNWVVNVGSNTVIKKVILGGYHKQSVSGLEKSVLVEKHTYEEGDSGYFYAYQSGDENYRKAMARLKTITGLDPRTFNSSYSASSFTLDQI